MKKYALVTASTKGIGKAIGLMLLKIGYHVFLNYANDDNNVVLLEKELFDYKGKYSIVKADISNYKGIDILLNSVCAITDNIDCIILNAGITCRKPYKNINYNDWEKVIATNLNVPFFTIQRFDNLINRNGRIIFIGSVLGIYPHSVSIAYSVSKAACVMLTKSLVKIYKNRDITVNMVAPGFVETSWHKDKDSELKEKIINKIAIKRFGYPEEIASACKHIIDNHYINGAVLQVDGGYNME